MTKHIICCLVILLAAPASAQRVDTVVVVHSAPAKDPATGTILGVLLPGGGQMYAGKVGEGMALLGVAIAAPLIGARIASTRPPLPGVSGTTYLSGLVGFAAWAFGWSNAANDAEAYNGTVRASALPSASGLTVGLSLRY